jgi:hypothetical protein
MALVTSPTATATSTVAALACAGDCNQSGNVSVDELVLGVNIALDRAALAACPVLDQNSSGRVEINELVSAVNSAVNGCEG